MKKNYYHTPEIIQHQIIGGELMAAASLDEKEPTTGLPNPPGNGGDSDGSQTAGARPFELWHSTVWDEEKQ